MVTSELRDAEQHITHSRQAILNENHFNNKKIDRHIKYIDEKINHYLKDLEENDQAEVTDRKPSAKEINERIKELRERKDIYEGYKKELQGSEKSEISTTDPDARLMGSNNKGVDISYNVQTAVDAKQKLIADYKVTTNCICQLKNTIVFRLPNITFIPFIFIHINVGFIVNFFFIHTKHLQNIIKINPKYRLF